MDFVDFLERRVADLMAHQEELGVTHDDGQQIVEIVRNATGELPDGLHFLRLRELGLERLLLGDVDKIEERAFVPCRGRTKSCAHALMLAPERNSAVAVGDWPSQASVTRSLI